ncbi:MAG: non-ribosomal peptide synthetase [Acidobacteria bacterium]|nr:non-ribosomal peptide synthetase [Acidobacteriota bacterium]
MSTFPESAIEHAVPRRFEAIARAHSPLLAIQDTSKALTYAELLSLSERVALAITHATAGRAGAVAILLDPEVSYPAAMLGALAAGRLYVPLDADVPTARNQAIVAAAGVCAILSKGHLLDTARGVAPPQTAIIDIDGDRGFDTGPAPRRSEAGDPACVLYTSGSTGTPKGVVLSHTNILKKAQQYTHTARITPADRLLVARAMSTAGSVRSIYGALLNGASLHILPPRQLGAAGLAHALRAHRVTVYHSAPTLLRRIHDALPSDERLDAVRIASLGGEAVEWDDFDICRLRFSPDVGVYTGLNSTESGGGYCQWFIDDALRHSTRRPPVGRPLPDRRVTLVDDEGRVVGDGEVGEIVVASRHVALGYWRGSDCTVEAFPSDPEDPNGRILKTGDLAIRRSDGLIEFAGRKDHLVKLHGQRINCSEIETALNGMREVNAAAVIVRRDATGAARALVGYVVREPAFSATLDWQIQATLAQTLPRHMVPSRILFLNELPRLPSLKIDRARLAEMDATQPIDLPSRADDPLLDEVAGIFEAVLDTTGASADDNMTSLGGDSLQATTLVAAIEGRFDVVIPEDLLAEDPTIRLMADWLRSAERAQA